MATTSVYPKYPSVAGLITKRVREAPTFEDGVREIYRLAYPIIAKSEPIHVDISKHTVEIPTEPLARSAYYLDFVERFGDRSFGGEVGEGEPGSKEQLEEHIENILETVVWCFSNLPKRAVLIIEWITTFLGDGGRTEELIYYSERALAIAREEQMPVSQLGFLATLGWNYLVQGNHLAARTNLIQGKKLAEELATSENKEQVKIIHKRHVQVLRDLGHQKARDKEYAESLQLIRQSEEKAKLLGDRLPILQAKLFRGWTYCLRGEYEVDIKSYERAKEILKPIERELENYPRQLTLALRLLGEVAIAQKEWEEGRTYLEKAQRNAKNRYFKAHELIAIEMSLGRYYSAQENYDIALEWYGTANLHAGIWSLKADAEKAKAYILELGSELPLEKPDGKEDNSIHDTHSPAQYSLGMSESLKPSDQEPALPSTENLLQLGALFAQQVTTLPEEQQAIVRQGFISALGEEWIADLQQVMPCTDVVSGWNALSVEDKQDLFRKIVSEAKTTQWGQALLATELSHTLQKKPIVLMIDDIIDELRTNWRVEHPTKNEIVLRMFQSNQEANVEFDNLTPLFSNSENAADNIWVFMGRLSKKLESYGYTIASVRKRENREHGSYQIVPFVEKPQNSSSK